MRSRDLSDEWCVVCSRVVPVVPGFEVSVVAHVQPGGAPCGNFGGIAQSTISRIWECEDLWADLVADESIAPRHTSSCDYEVGGSWSCSASCPLAPDRRSLRW